MIRLGIVGLGHWGPNYVRNLSTLGNAELKIVCDQDPLALSKIKKTYPHIKTTGRFVDLLEDTAIDAVVVATPASTHFKLVAAALSAGKHVLVEKPLCPDIKEGRALVGMANRKRKILMVAYTFLFNPAVRKLKELIANGELGEIYYLHATRTNLGPVRFDVDALWDLAPHDLSIFYYLLGRWPKQVSAVGGTYLQNGIADVSFATLHYGGGVLAGVHVSWLDPRKVRQITVIGSKKMALFDDLDAQNPVRLFDKGVMKTRFEKPYSSFKEFKIITRDAGVINPRIPKEEPLRAQCAHFIDCVENNKKPLTDARMGLDMLYVFKAMNESLKANGKPRPVILIPRSISRKKNL